MKTAALRWSKPLLLLICLRKRDPVFAEGDLVVKTHEFAVLLPENFLYEIILFCVPCGEIVLDKSACIAGVCIEAPEGVVDPVFLDELAHIGHPFEIRLRHIAAPFADKKGSYAFFLNEEPVVIPAVII